MSHYIIVNGRKVKGPHDDGLVATHEGETPIVEYNITFTPPHDIPLAEQIQRASKLQRLAAKIEAVAAGEDGE